MKKIFILMIGVTILTIISLPVYSASKSDIDKFTSYAVILGRASACGVDTEQAFKRVGAWMDKVFPPGSQDYKIYFPIFIEGLVLHARHQKSGNSPDTCQEVRKHFNKMIWP